MYIQSLENCLGISPDDSKDHGGKSFDGKDGSPHKHFDNFRSSTNDENQSVTSSSQNNGGPRSIKSPSSVIINSIRLIL